MSSASAKMEIPNSLARNPPSGVWDTQSVHTQLETEGQARNLQTTEHMLENAVWLPAALKPQEVYDEHKRLVRQQVVESLEACARKKGLLTLVLQLHPLADGRSILIVNDSDFVRRWLYLPADADDRAFLEILARLVQGKNCYLWPHGMVTEHCRNLVNAQGRQELQLPDGNKTLIALTAYPEVLQKMTQTYSHPAPSTDMTHLDRLEAESIHIMREVIAQAENPVMLYSVGKDSSVMLHLARKAFYPSSPPFPLMHVDTRWKFQAMYDFRDYMAQESGMELIVHINPEGVEKNINPFDHGSALHTDVMKTQGLKQALDQHGFDVAFGGARRDEETSRAKERVFSFRNKSHHWDPKNQRPELWNLYNGYKNPGESIRVFPLSNWTELDIWQYIHRENIPIVPLYFAAERPIVERDNMLIMVDDDRMRLLPGEEIQTRLVRFRTLGCYPLTGAIDSSADDLSSIVLELLESRTSERQGRAIDADSAGSMEKKKQEGYF